VLCIHAKVYECVGVVFVDLLIETLEGRGATTGDSRMMTVEQDAATADKTTFSSADSMDHQQHRLYQSLLTEFPSVRTF